MKWRAGERRSTYYVFDLLQAAGKSLIGLPVERRKELLASLCQDAGGSIRFSGEIGGDADALLREVKRLRLGRGHRETARLGLRTGPAQRRVDQTQMRE